MGSESSEKLMALVIREASKMGSNKVKESSIFHQKLEELTLSKEPLSKVNPVSLPT